MQVVERLLVDALGVLAPPGQGQVGLLGRIPHLVQVDAGVPRALGSVPLPDLRQAPVPCEPVRARVGAQGTLLRRGGIKSEPVRLDDGHRTGAPVAAATARRARFAAARRPYSRADGEVRISVTSRTRSSSTPVTMTCGQLLQDSGQPCRNTDGAVVILPAST